MKVDDRFDHLTLLLVDDARVCAFLEKAVRAAQREGLIPKGNAAEKARELYSYVMGVVLQAKIHNDLDLLEGLKPGVFRLLEVRELARR